MTVIEQILTGHAANAVETLYGARPALEQVQVQETRRDFEGHYTLVVFPLLKQSRQSPEATATAIGGYLKEHCAAVDRFNVIKGFLNLVVADAFWVEFLCTAVVDDQYGYAAMRDDAPCTMIEYSSPNTNKPLHLGHIRNNLLGWSLAKILAAAGHRIIKVNLVNDRGIHICKSMLAWQIWGKGETPSSSGKKGDHLVGDYYVKFDLEYKKEIRQLEAQGMDSAEAARNAPLMLRAQEMLRRWETGDADTVSLWKMMNSWVYEGFERTYLQLGVAFDRTYYESETYLQGREIVLEGLRKGIFFRKDDGSVWVDLTADGLDEKLLLRSDGTSVYITQDIGTACQRFSEYPLRQLVYVVGNEQNYHFQVLALVLARLGYPWAGSLRHMSYGMVELPEGKMKSREGTVVDADDLMDEMIATARTMSHELGKLDGLSDAEADAIVQTIGLGALKYFMLKVDPRKTMLFDPKESIDFNGNTGPFIQYTHARIQSVLRKADSAGLRRNPASAAGVSLGSKEVSLIKAIHNFPKTVTDAADACSPALIANYVYDLAREYNQFYHDYPILKETDEALRYIRLLLSEHTAQVIRTALDLLGIASPDRM